jgi:hypothetical protein
MSRKPYSLTRNLVVTTALALGSSGVALADDSSMNRLGGDSYAYFNRPMIGNAAAMPNWRQSHANGMTERELQALSSSDLSAFAPPFNPQLFARAPADPSWRQSHPNGLSERELQALSSSSLALWQAPGDNGVTDGQSNVAQAPSKGTLAARLMSFFHTGSGSQATTQ